MSQASQHKVFPWLLVAAFASTLSVLTLLDSLERHRPVDQPGSAAVMVIVAPQ